MPIYRNEGGGVWARLKSVYRYEGNGVWAALKNIYRYEGAGVWASIFSSAAIPTATTMPTLRNATNVNPDPTNSGTMFFGGDVITLTKGSYANVDADTKYTLTIRRSVNFDTTLGNWETVSGPTDLIGSQTGTLTYTVTDLEAKGGYYFAGRVRVDTDPTNPASTDYFFDVKNANALAKVSFTIGSFVVTSPTSNGATFSWSTSGLPATDTLTYIYNQKLEVKRTSDNVVVYTQDNIAAATSIVTVSNAQILPNTQYYGVITITANDGWKTSNYPTTQASASSNFTTTNPVPVNTTSPTITPLNNRSYAPVNTLLTCNVGAWTNNPTSYTYSWEYDNGNTNLPPEDRWGVIPGSSTSSGTYLPPSNYTSTYGSKIRCGVTATNASGSGIAYAGPYNVDSEVTISTISPTSVTAGTSTSFLFNVAGYPTSYVIDWTNDGTADYSSGAIPVSSVFSISSASGNGSQITYTCNNNFIARSTVSVSGMSVSSFNVSNAVIVSATSTSFTVNAAVSGSATGGTAVSNTSTIYASAANTYSPAGTYTMKVTAQPGNKQRTASISAVNTPSASGFTKADGTATPSQPGTISFSSASNQVTSSWTNGSPITSVRFQGSGAGVNTDYSDTTSPFITSDVSNYTSTATYNVTVTNTNSSLAVLVSWNQSNAASYRIDYSSSIFGADVATGDSSASSVSVSIPWNSNMGTFTLPGITVYSGTGQTGLSTFYSNPTGTGGVVPSSKSSTRTGSTSLTYSVAKPSGGSVTLTGSGVSGTSVSASTSGWSGSPTSYAVNIRVSTSSPVTSSGTSKASNSPATSTSASYTVTTNDANAPAYYFKAFATASNAGGTSDLVESSEILSSRLAKPTNLNLVYRGYNSTLSRYEWDAYWDGSTGASSYTAYREVGTYSGGVFTVYNTSTPQTGLTTLKAGTTNTYTTLFTTTTTYNWARFYVKAVNSLDDSGYEGPSTPA